VSVCVLQLHKPAAEAFVCDAFAQGRKAFLAFPQNISARLIPDGHVAGHKPVYNLFVFHRNPSRRIGFTIFYILPQQVFLRTFLCKEKAPQ
jgi:hypothetical protein